MLCALIVSGWRSDMGERYGNSKPQNGESSHCSPVSSFKQANRCGHSSNDMKVASSQA